ncbi:MAG: ATP-dependent sacrificial sulfur transferase LarE [Candidatus Omnitrophica bacterium]|nr:ATP-dependent sacrificial sulfur transferase LarE [Candidatus Omnitrophota bacterium]
MSKTLNIEDLDRAVLRKLETLQSIFSDMGSALIAYSGGVDSTLLTKVAKDVLKSKAVAVTSESETYPLRESRQAKELARQLGIRHIIINTRELDNEEFSKNSPQRCYFCKKELFSRLLDLAKQHSLDYVVEGSNHDDRSDYRPGLKAIEELGIRSPLKEAELTKKEIRILSKMFGLSSWNKPSFACLSSRFPYGTKITKDGLIKVDRAEGVLLKFGFSQLRVRIHGPIARIEVPKEDISLFFKAGLSDRVVEEFKKIGFFYVTLDLAGYETGSMNKLLKSEDKFGY